jgi:hypothetical protein
MRRLSLPDKKCLVCGGVIKRTDFKRVSDFKVQKYCSRDCYYKGHSGEKHHNWKGGVRTRPDGYMRDSRTDKYIHRLVMEKCLGRKLETWEHVHHIDGNPKNNDISNLQVLTNSEHRKLEHKIAPKDKYGRYAKK